MICLIYYSQTVPRFHLLQSSLSSFFSYSMVDSRKSKQFKMHNVMFTLEFTKNIIVESQ